MRLIYLSIFCFIATSLTAQVTFYASSDATQVVPGQYFNVSFTLENAKGANFKAPSFLEFDVAGGPSTSTQMTIINGRTSQKMSYSYTLTATNVGRYTIGPASIIVNGKELRSETLLIEVIKGRAVSADGQSQESDGFIVEAIIDYDTGYVGQQLILKYVLFTNQNVRSFNFTALPTFDGFFAQELQGYQSKPEQVIREGVPYYKRIIKVVALFPQQRGKFSLDPARVNIGVSDGSRSNNFFFNTRLKQYRVQSSSLDIEIVQTPEGAPLSFSGAIGDFYMGSAVDKKSITMDDAVTLTLQVRGFGDGKFIEAPRQPFTDIFDIYDPNLLEEKSEIVGDRIQTIKTYEYLMIPKKIGSIKFNPELTYYDVDSAKYITIYGQQYRVNVLKGSDRELADLENKQVELIRPPAVREVFPMNQHFAYSWQHLGANGLFLLGLMGMLVVRKIKDNKENVDPAIKRNLLAKKMALSQLSIAKGFLDQGDIKNFYIQLRKGLQEFLSDKTNQQTSQLSKDHISRLLTEFYLEEYLEPLLTIMQKGEQAIYASIAPGHEFNDYTKSLEIIGKIEISLDTNR